MNLKSLKNKDFSFNKKKVILLSLVGAIVIVLIILALLLPLILKNTIISKLEGLGARNTSIEFLNISMSHIELNNLLWENEAQEKQKVGYMRAQFNIGSLISNYKLKKVILDKVNLSASILDNKKLNLAGLKFLNTKPKKESIPALPFEQLELRQLSLILNMDDINTKFRIKGNLRPTKKPNEFKLLASILSQQDELTLDTRITGTINPIGKSNISLEILKGKSDYSFLKGKRISGWANTEYSAKDGFYNGSAEIVAGGLEIATIPFKSVSITYNNETKNTHLFMARGQAPNKAADFLLDIAASINEDLSLKGNLDINARKLEDLNGYIPGSDAFYSGHGGLHINFKGNRSLNLKEFTPFKDWKEFNGAVATSFKNLSLNKESYFYSGDSKFYLNNKDNKITAETSEPVHFNIFKESGSKIKTIIPSPIKIKHSSENGLTKLSLPKGIQLEVSNQKINYTSLIDIEINNNGGTLNTKGGRLKTPHIIIDNILASLSYGPKIGGKIEFSALKDKEKRFPDLQGEFIIKSKDNKNLNFTGSLADQTATLYIQVNGKHNIKSDNGTGNIYITPISFQPGVLELAEIFPITKKHLSETIGSISFDSTLEWFFDKESQDYIMKSDGNVLIKNIETLVEGNKFSGLNAVIHLDQLYPLSIKSQKVGIAGIDAGGIPLTNGLVTFSLNESNLSIEEANWNFADGVLDTEPFSINLNKIEGDMILKARGLDMQKLFGIAALEGLSATGKAEGKLPIHLSEHSIKIKNGLIETSDTGVIKYNPRDVPPFLANPREENIIHLKEALRNFEYEWLKMEIDGETGKNQKIKLSTKGKNPNFYEGSPVELNINLEGALENVFKYNLSAYQMPDTIKEQIEAYEGKHANEN